MSAAARLLVLMGSGETSPTMVKTHRAVLARLGPPPVTAVVLDTPFGFQANADDLTNRAIAYFGESVGQRLDAARFRAASEVGSVGYETMLGQLRDARFVFAGPGSPTYALRQWAESLVPSILEEKLAAGGCVTFASAAALTLGIATVPVYEIYKVGAAPEWHDGLDLIAAAGLRAAVIPHYNNAEGGTHDTRFCYLGEDRLRVMETQLPDDAFVLGIDEHTGCVIDLDAATAEIVGLGVLTVRVDGRSHETAAGTTLSLDDIRSIADSLRSGVDAGVAPARTAPAAPQSSGATSGTAVDAAASPLLAAVADREAAFEAAVAGRDTTAAVQAVLDLETDLHAWAADTLQSDEMDKARAALRSMVTRLGALAATGTGDPADLVGPFVDVLLGARRSARDDKRWADADVIRDELVRLGVEVRDTAEGTEWSLG